MPTDTTVKTSDPLAPRLLGKRFYLAGKLTNRDRETLVQRITTEGGAVVDAIDAQIWAVVIAADRGSADAVKTANSLIKAGASIRLLDTSAFEELFAVDAALARAMLLGGSRGIERWKQLCEFGAPTPIDLTGINLSGHDLRDIYFRKLTLDDADFRGADLRDAELQELKRAKFGGAKLRGTTFWGLTECSFAGCDLSGARIHGSLAGCDLTDATLLNAEMRGLDFKSMVLKHTDLRGIKIDRPCDGRGVNLAGLNLDGANMAGSDFSGACLAGAKLSNAIPGITFIKADLSGADLSHSDLGDAKCAGANLRGAILQNAILANADFSNADLTNADLRDADLRGADLTGAMITDADFTGALTRGMKTNPATVATAKNLIIQDVDPIGPKLQELVNANAGLKYGASLTLLFDVPSGRVEATLYAEPKGKSRAHFNICPARDPQMVNEINQAPEQMLADWVRRCCVQFKTGWLRVDGCRTHLQGSANISGEKMTELLIAAACEAMGTTPEKALDIQTKNIAANRSHWIDRLKTGGTKAIDEWNAGREVMPWRCGGFEKTDFSNLPLAGLVLSDMALTSCKFDKTDLTGSEFIRCDLKKASFTAANVSKVTISGSKLNGVNFTQANLKSARIVRSVATGAIFKNADLTEADFNETDLRGADFGSAILSEASLTDAIYDEKTLFPDGFVPRSMKWKGKGLAPLVYGAVAAGSKSATAGELHGKVAPVAQAVIDFATLMDRLSKSVDAAKLDKAMKMLKAERFQLFSQTDEKSLAGIVKSQSEPDLIYCCKITDDGSFACCTQNLNTCGGLRGSLCKHLLVLIIGLAKAGAFACASADAWSSLSTRRKPELDKEAMGEILLKYKGVEAGEIDWRPTETVPEDYYAL